MKKLALMLTFLAMAPPVHANPAVTGKTYVGQTYARVRAKLIRRGIIPIRIPHENMQDGVCLEDFCAEHPKS